MTGRGVHFALGEDAVRALREIPEAERASYIGEVIEADYFAHHSDRLVESDKAWDAIHRALTDGQLHCADATSPLNLVILGGESLYGGDDYIISLKTPQQVRRVDEALSEVDEATLRSRYFAIDADDYGGQIGEEDFTYTWDWFEAVRTFWSRAARDGRFVIFTVDQ